MSGSEPSFEDEVAGITDPDIGTPEGEIIPPENQAPTDWIDLMITPQIVGLLLAMPGSIMARKTGEEWWQINAEEKELLGEAATPGIRFAVRKYLSESVGPWAGLATAAGIVYGPRMVREAMERKERESKPKPPLNRHSEKASASSSAKEGAASPGANSDFKGLSGDV